MNRENLLLRKPRFYFLMPSLFLCSVMLVWCIIFYRKEEPFSELPTFTIFAVFTAAMLLMLVVFTIYYILLSRGQAISYGKADGLISYSDNKREITFTLEDILKCEMVAGTTAPLVWTSGFIFLNIYLVGGRHIVITDYCTSINKFVEQAGLLPQYTKVHMPVLYQMLG